MNEEQKKKFEEWWSKQWEWWSKQWQLYGGRLTAKMAWEACLYANKVEEQEPEPSPTEMVKRLLEKGWTVEAYPDTDMTFFRSPDGKNRLALIAAYHQVFPRKKKVEVEVWLDSDGCVRVIPAGLDPKTVTPRRVSWGWTKGIATFWVEEEQPCTSEDGSS